jgi:hypothetical protein
MKQKILNLKKKLLLVEIEPFDSAKIINEKNVSYFGQKMNLIGKLTDITEEQCIEWVPNSFNSLGNGIYEYADYCNNEICMLPTAKESFFSYLEKEGIYFENPHKFPLITDKEFYDEPYSGLGFYPEIYGHAIKRWQEAEDKVWKLNNTYLFEII